MVISKFCRHCGKPLQPTTKFCEFCGSQVIDTNTGIPYNNQKSVGKTKKKLTKPNIVVLLVGLLLCMYALRIPVLFLLGNTTMAVVTDVRQIINSSSSAMDHDYRVSYSFITDDDKRINGSYDMGNVFNYSNLPQKGSTVTIRYLPFFPSINYPANRKNSVLFTLIVGALGITTITLAVMGKFKKASTR